MALNDTESDLWMTVDHFIKHIYLTDRFEHTDPQLGYTLTVHDEYHRMRDNYCDINVINAKLVYDVLDMILQTDCSSDNANKDDYDTMNDEDVDSRLNLHVDQAGTYNGDLCNDCGHLQLNGHDPEISPEDGAEIGYYVSHALDMLLHDDDSCEHGAFDDRSILAEYSAITSPKDRDHRVHVKTIGHLLLMEAESRFTTSGCISNAFVCSTILNDDTGNVSIDVATTQIIICYRRFYQLTDDWVVDLLHCFAFGGACTCIRIDSYSEIFDTTRSYWWHRRLFKLSDKTQLHMDVNFVVLHFETTNTRVLSRMTCPMTMGIEMAIAGKNL
jgi:hypothetical protein